MTVLVDYCPELTTKISSLPIKAMKFASKNMVESKRGAMFGIYSLEGAHYDAEDWLIQPQAHFFVFK